MFIIVDLLGIGFGVVWKDPVKTSIIFGKGIGVGNYDVSASYSASSLAAEINSWTFIILLTHFPKSFHFLGELKQKEEM